MTLPNGFYHQAEEYYINFDHVRQEIISSLSDEFQAFWPAFSYKALHTIHVSSIRTPSQHKHERHFFYICKFEQLSVLIQRSQDLVSLDP